ncbi:MAG: endolytic transglycosylase MltG, partial [Gammaproteobacteria bacterium]
ALGMAGAQDPEGLLFPDTYHFPGNTPDSELLRRARMRMQKILEKEWRQRADGLPYNSPYEALIMASLVEKEASLPEERPLIAGVFVRRLQKGMPLQADPTIIYALGDKFDGNIRKPDMAIDSPYNTYLNAGLPPTPIAMPGRDSLYAALHPDNGNALYFVAKGDGAHHFSDTFTEHQKAVSMYQLGNGGNE